MMNKQTAKKKFAHSVCEFMQRKAEEGCHGKYKGEDMFHLSEDGSSIICNIPSDFFYLNEIEPMTVEMKFTVKK